MLESIYIGTTGLVAFTTGLANISNNVANMNTAGFKESALQFADLFYQFQANGDNDSNRSPLALGEGTQALASHVVFKQGELRQTGNEQDAAIDGIGLFVLRKDGEVFYTRSGEFEFDPQGYLAARSNGARVAALASGNALSDININGLRTSAPAATSHVTFTGNLSANDSDNLHVLNSIAVFDSSGASNTLSITFTNNGAATPRSWLIDVKDQVANTVASGEIRFQGDGSPAVDFNTLAFTFSPPVGAPVPVTLDFGQPGNFSAATNFSGASDSTLAVKSQDGFGVGALTKAVFDADGFVVASYSNGQTLKIARLALASFESMQQLEQTGGNLFINRTGQTPIAGVAQTSLFGKIVGASVEGSNVDLSQQFAELIILQRGFQASSQVITTANEMIQQLYDIKSRG